MTRHYTKNPNSLRQLIEDLLREHGGMTLSDIMEELPDYYTKGGVSKTLLDLRDAGLAYVKDWEMTQPGQKRHPRPVWDHAEHSKRQPPANKMRPLPVSNAVRLKRRRLDRKAHGTQVRYMFKLIKVGQKEEGASE